MAQEKQTKILIICVWDIHTREIFPQSDNQKACMGHLGSNCPSSAQPWGIQVMCFWLTICLPSSHVLIGRCSACFTDCLAWGMYSTHKSYKIPLTLSGRCDSVIYSLMLMGRKDWMKAMHLLNTELSIEMHSGQYVL